MRSLRGTHRVAVAALAAAALLAGAVPAGAKSRATVAAVPDTELVALGPDGAGTHAFVAWPERRANAPAIVVVHEWWGLNDQIRGIARRLAHEGYVAIVPDLYHGQVATDPQLAHELSRAMEDDHAYDDLDAAIAWLRAQPATAKSRLAAIGFCMGGRLSQGLALRRGDLAGAVMFYGVPETSPERLKALSAPLLAHFGATDRGIPPERADALRRGLAGAGRSGEVYVYSGAGHAFMNESGTAYHADAARSAWARTLAFLQKRLKG